jgi:hypothetical protein
MPVMKEPTTRCIGSRCMLWTKLGPPRDKNGDPTGQPSMGYCGLGPGPGIGDEP